MGIPHKHAELIKKWADGEVIQVKDSFGWAKVSSSPTWTAEEYRVEPKAYPKSTLSYSELCALYNLAFTMSGGESSPTKAMRLAVDAAIAEFITSGEMMKYLKSEGIYEVIEKGNY